MYTGMLHTHTLMVMLFLLIYLIKTILLFFSSTDKLAGFSKKIKVPEMIISTLFLATGIYLAYNTGNVGSWLYVKILVVLASIPLAVVAFKKGNKVLALISLVLLIYAYGISETKSPTFKMASMVSDYEGVASEQVGEKIFSEQCSHCHGMDGRGVLSGAKDLTASELSLDDKITIINNGKNAMIPYSKILSADQIEAVGNYVHAMAE